jgi:hypothetical protein
LIVIVSHPVGAKRRRMTGSAKQSRTAQTTLDCFVAEPVIGLAEGETRWLLAMTVAL